MIPFFVYGTLRRLGTNHGLIEQYAINVVPATLRGFNLYQRGIPYIGIGAPHSYVIGDLITFDINDYATAADIMDALEGYDPPNFSLYYRMLVGVRPLGEDLTTAWVYLGGDTFSFRDEHLITSGDYFRGRF